MPEIEIPRFKFGFDQKNGGVGQGDGDKAGQGKKAGNKEGDKALEAEFTTEELAELLGEELGLPKIEPKGANNIKKKVVRYDTLGTTGPDSLKNLKKTLLNSIKRQIASGEYDPKNPKFLPRKKDFRYRSFTEHYEYDSAATVFYVMDVSGSMGETQKEMARSASFWINTWLKANYKDINIRYIIHDSTAKEVDEKTFFSTKESGGTLISSAYKLLKNIITSEDIRDNIYIFQYSDGDNWGSEDDKACVEILKDFLLKVSNLFGYSQTVSRFGSGNFGKVLKNIKHDDLIIENINSRSDIIKSIKGLLGSGK